MHIKFEDVQAVDDEVILQTSRKCCKNFNQSEITYRQDEVELWFFQTALSIIATSTNASFKSIRLEMTNLCSLLRTIPKNFLIQITLVVLV